MAGNDAMQDLIRILEQMGYPREFGIAIGNELHSEKMIMRMCGYLRSAKPKRPEDIVDEMLAIKSDVDRWVSKKKAEYTNSRLNEYMNMPHDED